MGPRPLGRARAGRRPDRETCAGLAGRTMNGRRSAGKDYDARASRMSRTMPLAPHRSVDLVELLRLERRGFAARLRVARAVLGLSQSELGRAVGLTQRAIHKLEQGDTEPRRATQRLIEEL